MKPSSFLSPLSGVQGSESAELFHSDFPHPSTLLALPRNTFFPHSFFSQRKKTLKKIRAKRDELRAPHSPFIEKSISA
jgi:hypothetical protein